MHGIFSSMPVWVLFFFFKEILVELLIKYLKNRNLFILSENIFSYNWHFFLFFITVHFPLLMRQCYEQMTEPLRKILNWLFLLFLLVQCEYRTRGFPAPHPHRLVTFYEMKKICRQYSFSPSLGIITDMIIKKNKFSRTTLVHTTEVDWQ